ncbi:RND family efflux transporter MFP subunit [Mesorhizobium soli]|uniref:efflux RND transporter periplasmic adaptor subunit n=1 Tax=Pseudaminobacter soli (ex Li et al. 2025) TaxID=1295366 RepID=UPI002476B637|nr:efflux RND transporter periplasmic adaptor subunit [Mesorhizobium soli]MDH6231091.1 RND family efflux transporter MFP subunit [Mesorhizobium soli]
MMQGSAGFRPRRFSHRAAHDQRKPLDAVRAWQLIVALGLCALIAGCQRQEETPEPLPLMVRAQKVEIADYAPTASLTGVIAAQTLDNLSFRVGGRVAQRMADVGQHVTKGTVLAKLDPQTQHSDLIAAQANLDAAQAELRQVSAAFARQKTLLGQGFTTRRDYDQADQTMRTAQASVQTAQSQVANAKENLSFTELRAGVSGVITARDVETGQVVQAAQTVFTIAQDGDRDAVFNVQETLVANTPAAPPVTITLLANPQVKAQGKVREVSPVIDPATASVRIKVAIPNTPAAMPLGASVTGTITTQPRKAIILPWQTLTANDGKPAVWIIDPETRRVSMTPVEVLAYDSGIVVIDRGLASGDIVVTAGGQLLHPGQAVEVAENAK